MVHIGIRQQSAKGCVAHRVRRHACRADGVTDVSPLVSYHGTVDEQHARQLRVVHLLTRFRIADIVSRLAHLVETVEDFRELSLSNLLARG